MLLECGMIPIVPHFYALVLDDSDPVQRELGLKAGQALLRMADELWCFGGRVTPGMSDEIKLARRLNMKVRYFDRRKKILGGYR